MNIKMNIKKFSSHQNSLNMSQQNNRGNNQGNNQRRNGNQSTGAQPKRNRDEAIAASRTLFVRNVQFDTQEKEVIDQFMTFGDIKTIFNLIAKRGLIFITFVTTPSLIIVRLEGCRKRHGCITKFRISRQKGWRSLLGAKRRWCPWKSTGILHFSKNQASVTVTFDGGEPLVTHVLFEFMSKFGEIKSVRDDLQLLTYCCWVEV